MTSTGSEDFWEDYRRLPKRVQALAVKCYERWIDDPRNSKTQFKKIVGKEDWWEARIGMHYRALCVRDGERCEWFFIGSHEETNGIIG